MLLSKGAKKFMEDARFNAQAMAYETQWSATVVSSFINNSLLAYQSTFQSIHVYVFMGQKLPFSLDPGYLTPSENCAIPPIDLCPVRKERGRVAAKVQSTATSQAADDSAAPKTTRMIDLAVRLDLTPDE